MQKYYIICVCICSLRYPACYAPALYCPLWPARLYNIFPHYLINDRIFEETLLNIKYVLIFSTASVCNIFHSKKKWARCGQNCILIFLWSTRYSWPILMKLNFLDRFLKNTQISIVMKTHPVWTVLSHADGRSGVTNLIVALHNCELAPKISLVLYTARFRWPHGLRRRSAAAVLRVLRIRNPPEADPSSRGVLPRVHLSLNKLQV
jgi:hypothetical protein